MPNIKFPTSSSPGARPQESGGRLINAFVERAPFGAPSDTIIVRSPGTRYILTAPSNYIHTRGFLQTSSTSIFLWVVNGRVLAVDTTTWAVTDLGALGGNDPVTVARNNAVTNQMVVVTKAGCFNLFTASPPTGFVDPDLPVSPTSVCDYDGYFIWSFGSGHIYASQLNSVDVNALSFNVEQGNFLRRVVRFAGRLYAFGDKWTSVYRNAGTTPFPLAREVVIPRGIVGTHAVAGWETGWANNLIWAGEDFNVYKLQAGGGYTPQPLFNKGVSRAIQDAVQSGLRDFIEGFVYMYRDNAFFVLTCHDSWTWEHNLATGEWNERRTHDQPNWKGMKSIWAKDWWIIGCDTDGDLFWIDGEHYYDGIEPLIWEVESGVMSGFPIRTVIPRASFHITTGVGVYPGGVHPQVAISWSLDGGHTYGDPVLRRLGDPGETKHYPAINGSGISRGQGVRYRLRVSSPVHVGLSGGIVDAEQRGVQG